MSPTANIDITSSLITQLKKNGATAHEWDGVGWIAGLGGVIARLSWFKGQVQNKGPWDFKNNIYKPYRTTGVEVCGQHYNYDMPGNFHYGFVGAAAGISDFMLHKGAAHAQKKAGTSKPEYHCTGGDDPVDYEFIRLGIKLYDDFGLHFAQANLKDVLAGFRQIKCKEFKFKPGPMPGGGIMGSDGIIRKSPGEM
jgi:hypothetical protein